MEALHTAEGNEEDAVACPKQRASTESVEHKLCPLHINIAVLRVWSQGHKRIRYMPAKQKAVFADQELEYRALCIPVQLLRKATLTRMLKSIIAFLCTAARVTFSKKQILTY